MIKLSNKKIVEDIQVLTQIAQRKLPIKVSFAIAKNLVKIEGILNIYNTERTKLIEKYCEKDEKGSPKIENNSYVIPDEGKVDWNKESAELLEIENEVDIHKFNLAEFSKGNYELTPSEIMTIEYMIEE